MSIHSSNKYFTAKWSITIFFALLALFVTALLIYGYNDMNNPKKVEARSYAYACGKFGNQQMRIDKNYLYWGMVNYQDVNYWGGNIKEEHSAKGCNDQIQSADFTVKWPEMSASKEGFSLGSKNKNDITISLRQRSVWKEDWGNKEFFDHMGLLKNLLRKGVFSSSDEVSEAWLHATKKFNSNLNLYQVEVETDSSTTKTVYWQEVKGKGVSLVIECLYFYSGSTNCVLTTHEPNYGFNTSYIKISFDSVLLSHWQKLHQDAVQLIHSFNIEGK